MASITWFLYQPTLDNRPFLQHSPATLSSENSSKWYTGLNDIETTDTVCGMINGIGIDKWYRVLGIDRR